MPESHRKPHPKRLRASGGYRKLASFQTATLIYDGTAAFCKRFVSGYSRTHDQMVQAARSGRQNIAEGSRAGGVSSKSELKLTNVARASLEELLLDFEDYLRQHDLPLWSKDSPEAREVRALGHQIQDAPAGSTLADPQDAGDRARSQFYADWLFNEDATVAANTLLCLIHQANYLLDQQLIALERDFIDGGGYSEQLATARITARRKKDQSDRPDPSNPKIPKCPD